MRFFLVGSLVLATIALGGAQTLSIPVHIQTHLPEAPESLAVSLPSEQGSFLPIPTSVRSSMPTPAMAPQPSAPASGTILIGAACILLASGGTLRHLLRRETDGFRIAKGQKIKGF